MPTEVELESLVTKLEGDNKDLIQKLKESEEAFKSVGKQANDAVALVAAASAKVASQTGEIATAATKENDKVIKDLANSLRRSVYDVERETGDALNSLGTKFTGFSEQVKGATLSILGLEGGFISLAQTAVKLHADAMSLQISFEVLIGSADKAKTTIAGLVKFAADTPFELPEVVSAGKQLLSFGEQADDLVPIMQRLGDVASGVEKPLNEIVYTFGSIKTQGRAMTQDIKEFSGRGIPIYLALGKVLKLVDKNAKQLSNTARGQLNKQIEEGKITYDVVNEAFKVMTESGGAFNGMMEKQSKELKGLYSTMKDDINAALRDLGETIAKELRLKEAMQNISDLAKAFKEMDPELRRAIVNTVAISGAVAVGIGLFLSFKIALGGATLLLGSYATAANMAALATTGLKLTVIGLAAMAIYEFSGAKEAVSEYFKAVEEGGKLSASASAPIEKRYQNLIERTRTMTDLQLKKDLIDVRSKEGAKEELKLIEDREAALKKYNEVLAKNSLKLGDKVTLSIPGSDQADLFIARQQIELYDAKIAGNRKGLQSLKEELASYDKKQKESTNQAIMDKEEYLKKLQFERESLGLTADAIEILKMKKAGLTEADAANIAPLQQQLIIEKQRQAVIEETAKKKEDVTKSYDDMIEKLKEEKYALIGNIEEYKRSQLAREANRLGINAQVREKQNEIRIQLKEIELQKQFNEDMETRKGVLEALKTPLQEYMQQQVLLKRLFGENLLTWDQFSKAMDNAETKFREATQAAHDFQDALKGVDAALSGSAEAKARINAYLEMIRLQKEVKRTWTLDAPMPRRITERAPEPRDAWTHGTAKMKEFPPQSFPEENKAEQRARDAWRLLQSWGADPEHEKAVGERWNKLPVQERDKIVEDIFKEWGNKALPTLPQAPGPKEWATQPISKEDAERTKKFFEEFKQEMVKGMPDALAQSLLKEIEAEFKKMTPREQMREVDKYLKDRPPEVAPPPREIVPVSPQSLNMGDKRDDKMLKILEAIAQHTLDALKDDRLVILPANVNG